MRPRTRLIITCEHGGNRIPSELRSYFRGREKILNSHRGYDPGALQFARKISASLKAPFFYEQISRLVVEQNRSRGNPRVFSKFVSFLPEEQKQRLLREIYDPYHKKVFSAAEKAISEGKRVLHFSVHSFTPVLNGEVRNADTGFLYDPKRKGEKEICLYLQKYLAEQVPGVRVRRNYPYLGISDGLTKQMRMRYPEKKYLGIEIEVNQKHYRKKTGMKEKIEESIIGGIADSIFFPLFS